jgi:hypothetical protein
MSAVVVSICLESETQVQLTFLITFSVLVDEGQAYSSACFLLHFLGPNYFSRLTDGRRVPIAR